MSTLDGSLQKSLSSCGYRWSFDKEKIVRNQEVGYHLVSPPMGNQEIGTYKLKLYPSGLNEILRDELCMIIECLSSPGTTIGFSVKFDSIKQISCDRWTPKSNTLLKAVLMKKKKCIVALSKVPKPKEKITIVLTLTYNVGEQILNNITSLFPSALEKYKSLYLNKQSTDIEFVISNKSLYAHKLILSMEKSFESMIEKSSTNRIKIADVEYDVFENVIKYIYYGEVVGLETNVDQYFVLSQKYEMVELNGRCVEVMENQIDLNNAMHYYNIGFLYNHQSLQEKSFNFMVENRCFFISLAHESPSDDPRFMSKFTLAIS